MLHDRRFASLSWSRTSPKVVVSNRAKSNDVWLFRKKERKKEKRSASYDLGKSDGPLEGGEGKFDRFWKCKREETAVETIEVMVSKMPGLCDGRRDSEEGKD